jgi:hypothetical protein
MEPKFPYDFCRRPVSGKKKPEELHEKLLPGHYDIAFEISWTTKSPTALNPCEDTSVKAHGPGDDEDSYAGYNKRWLETNDRLAISPFTVKGAVANGFANLMGGCYRVIEKKATHQSVEQGNYPYNGGCKRYRVSMAGMSRPGILQNIRTLDTGDREVEIQPVDEYYYDAPTPPNGIVLTPGHRYFVEAKEDYHKLFIGEIAVAATGGRHEQQVTYYGPYQFGMDLTLAGGQLRKNHYHRFYRTTGAALTGHIRQENFETLEELKNQVYMGIFKRLAPDIDPRNDKDGDCWYEDLLSLQAGDWVYYEEFGGEITNIGKNFLFKALFCHKDAVPEGNRQCTDMNCLCPKCRMFGMTDTTRSEDATMEEDERPAVGFQGRFKAAALVCQQKIQTRAGEQKKFLFLPQSVPLQLCKDGNGKVLAYQVLLPILGAPKPNKRDMDGYFALDSGAIKGAKYYHHGELQTADNIGDVDNKDCTHRLRNYVQVCETGVEFTGTLGAENCTLEEIAAFLVLLDSKKYGHYFKLGLGKAFGLGSVKSAIKRIWLRKSKDYTWKTLASADTLEKELLALPAAIELLQARVAQQQELINRMEQLEKLAYPDPRDYWKKAHGMGLSKTTKHG